jgi:NCK-associated protein 1
MPCVVSQLDVDPVLCENFMDLYVSLAQILFFMSHNLEERKLLVLAYNMAYSAKNHGSKDEASGRILNFMKDYANPVKKLWDDYRPFGARVLNFLSGLYMNYIRSRTPAVLRKEGATNITAQPAKLSMPVNTTGHLDLIRSHKYYQWFVFGFLLHPEDLGGANPGDAFNQMKGVINDTLHVQLFRDEYLPIYKEYEQLFEYKSKTAKMDKHAKILKEGKTEGLQIAGQKHKERRAYVRQELRTLYCLMIDTPALIAPKLQVILAALSLAKEEILWWFRHTPTELQAQKTKVSNVQHFEDNLIGEVVYFSVMLTDLVRRHKDQVQNYYMEYLQNADATRLGELSADANFQRQCSSEIISAVQNITATLKRVQPGQDLNSIRDYWYQVEPQLSNPSKAVPVTIIGATVEKVRMIFWHMRFVDSLDEVLSEVGSLRELWYFRNELHAAFLKSIEDGPEQPTQVSSYLVLLSQAVENATVYDPSERDRIGAESIRLANEFLEKLSDRVVLLLEQTAKHQYELNAFIQPDRAYYSILDKNPELRLGDKNWRSPPEPGAESAHANRNNLENLRRYQKNIIQLCSGLNEWGSLIIYNTIFTPRQFLGDRLKKFLKSVLKRSLFLPPTAQPFKEEQTIQTPSFVARVWKAYSNTVAELANYVDLDVAAIVKEVMLHEAWSPSVGPAGGKLDWINEKNFEYLTNSYIGHFAGWYSDFFKNRALALTAQAGTAVHIVYSPSRRGFWSKKTQTSPFKAEMYMDPVELRAIADLTGAYGIKLIDREVLRFILANVNAMRETVKACSKELDELEKNYLNEGKTGIVLKSFKQPEMDAFMQRSIVVGSALQFRRLLNEAQGLAASEAIPFIYNTVDHAFGQYSRNTFMTPDFVGTDSLAADAGLNIGTADQALKAALFTTATTDPKIWDMFVPMFAACVVTSSYWRDATFNSAIGGHENNLHCCVRTIVDLLASLKGATSETADEEELTDLLRQFVEISSVLLLRALTSASAKENKYAPRDFASVMVFFDMFIEDNPLLMRDDLEYIIPYALLRSMWRQNYSKITKGKTGEDVEEMF